GIEGDPAMHWFRKDREPDIWEIADDQPAGDIGAAHKIRDICASAEAIADKMAAVGGRRAERKRAAEAERYQAAGKCALEISMGITTTPCATIPSAGSSGCASRWTT